MYTPYKLARELHGHSADVRAVAVLSTGHVATGSRDHSIRVWDPQNQGLSRTLNAHENFVASLTPLSPTPDIPNRLFASGGNDKVICVWDATCTIMSNTTSDNNNNNNSNNDANMTDEVNPASILIGHEGVVCALSSTVDGDIISGSWDKTARVWRNGNCAQELKGHEQSVWAVLGLPTGEIVTASADSTIKLWRGPVGEMKCYKTLKQHTDCVRGLALLPNGVGFVSCSNDESLIVWSLEGEVLQVLRGHTGFVYAVNVVHTGPDAYVIASGSEDRTLRIWRDGDSVQTITHPSGVWSVASGGDGLLVTGCADGVAREWTQDAARVASEDVIEAYEKSVASTSVHKSAVGDLQMDKLPGLDALAKPGNKDGEHLIVKTPAGGAELYSWSAAEGKWAKIGDVVDANEKQSKQVLAGKEYDYVFDIDVNDGTPYKLGYNTGENPYMVAQEFIWREELDQAFLDEVAQFIIKNTGNASMTLGGPSYADPFTGANRYIPGSNPAQTGAAGVDPFTGGNRYVPGSTPQPSTSTGTGNNRYAPYTTPTPSSSSSSSSTSTSSITSKSHLFPQQLMTSYEGGNIDGLQKKLAEFNAVVPQPLNDAEMKDINALIATLKDQARYHASRVTEDQMRLVVRKLLQWPAANLLPALDLLRLLFTHSHAAETLASLRLTPSLFNTVFTIASDTTSPTNSMLALRVIANMFKASAARKLVETNQAQVLELLPTTAVSDNKNIAHASATILLNLTVFYRTQPFEMGIKQVLSILRAALSRSDVPADVALRLVLAAGTLATIPGVHAESILTALPAYTSSPDKDLREAATALAQMLA